MGLKNKNNKFVTIHKLGTILRFGRAKNNTIKEVIDDGECSLIQYYINEGVIELDNEAYKYLRNHCSTCRQCKDIF